MVREIGLSKPTISRREFVSFGASENWFPVKEECAIQEADRKPIGRLLDS